MIRKYIFLIRKLEFLPILEMVKTSRHYYINFIIIIFEKVKLKNLKHIKIFLKHS